MLMGLAMALSFSACQQEKLANEAETTDILSRSTDDKYIVHIDTNEAGAGKLEELLTAQAEADGNSVAFIDWLFVEGPINADDLTYIASHRYLDSLNIENTTIINQNGVETTTLPKFNNIQSKMGIALPKGITIIQEMNNGNFRYVTIPDGVSYLGDFSSCHELKSITMPNSITSMGGFDECTALKYVKMSDSLEMIPTYSFYACSSLEKIHLPEKATCIERIAFQDCSSLTDINIPDNLTTIGWRAFSGCSSLGNITLPSTLKTIDEEAFYACSQLTTQLPDGLETIGSSAFRNCSRISSLTIPESVTSIGTYAFAGTGISTVDMGENTPIVSGMFANCQKLKAIRIPNTSTGAIPFEFLAGCISLESVEIPAQTIGIDERAFQGCLSVKEIVLPESVREIGDYAFALTGISTLTIPSKVKECGTLIAGSCPNLSAIFWESESDVPLLVGTTRCNVLLYVNNNQATVDAGNPNIIINGTAESITLYDNLNNMYGDYYKYGDYGDIFLDCEDWSSYNLVYYLYIRGIDGNSIRLSINPFHCPQTFTAKKATYVRDFSDNYFNGWDSQTTPGESNRWQSIVLPFKPTSFKAKDNSNTEFTKVLAPFDADVPDAKPFWLRELTASGYVDVTALEANKPYIISMPYSDRYLPEYNINSEVEFSAENVTFEVTGKLQPSAGPSYSLTPTYSWMEQQEEYLSINQGGYEYATKQYYAPGSVFVSDRDIRPFEAYIYQPGTNTRAVISIASGNVGTRAAGSIGQIPKKEDAGY